MSTMQTATLACFTIIAAGLCFCLASIPQLAIVALVAFLGFGSASIYLSLMVLLGRTR